MEANVVGSLYGWKQVLAGLPLRWKKLVQDSHMNVAVFDLYGATEAKRQSIRCLLLFFLDEYMSSLFPNSAMLSTEHVCR